MKKIIPPQSDTTQADTPPTPWTEKDFAEHWTSKGRAMLTSQEWEITLWLSGLPPEDYQERRQYLAAGLGMKPATLDALYELTFDEAREFVMRLSQEDFEDQRIHLSKWLGIRLSVLDGWRAEAKKTTKPRKKEKAPDDPPPPFPVDEPWDDPVDLAEVLGEIRETLAAHMAMPAWQVHLIAPWIALTYYRDDEELWYAPLLGINSPVLQCGKSRLLGLIRKLCHNPLPVSSISPAAIYRAVDLWHPTLFYDELDAVFSRKGENEELRAVFNAGYSRDFPFVVRCAEKTNLPEAFDGFGFKAFAGIGEAPATVRDRAILIPLARRPAGVHVQRIDRKDLHLKSAEIRRKLLRWSQDNQGVFSHPPDMDVEDRLRDNLEPLLCIAERAGSGEADLLRTAIAELTKTENEDSSAGIRLLTAIRPIIEDTDKITSKDLILRLCEAEDAEWKERGRKREEITPIDLSRLLRPFGVSPKTMRIDGKTPKGYDLEMFQDAFSRYLPATPATTVQTKDLTPISTRNKIRNVAGNESDKPFRINDVAGVAGGNTEIRGKQKEKDLFAAPSHAQGGTVTAAFGIHLGEAGASPEDEGGLHSLLLDVEARIADGRMSKVEGTIYLWDFISLKVKPPSINRWWTTPWAQLSSDQRGALERGGMIPKEIFAVESWKPKIH